MIPVEQIIATTLLNRKRTTGLDFTEADVMEICGKFSRPSSTHELLYQAERAISNWEAIHRVAA